MSGEVWHDEADRLLTWGSLDPIDACMCRECVLTPPSQEEPMRHHPTYHVTSRHGCWATCSCGWKSATWREQAGAQLDFGQHLLLVENPIPKETR